MRNALLVPPNLGLQTTAAANYFEQRRTSFQIHLNPSLIASFNTVRAYPEPGVATLCTCDVITNYSSKRIESTKPATSPSMILVDQ